MNKLSSFLKKHSVEIVLIVLIAIFGIARPDTFLKTSNFITILRQSAITGIMSLGMMICMISGGLNLAIGSMVSLVTVISAVMLTRFGMHWSITFLIAIAVSTLIGWVTGVIIVRTKIWPMIGSLAMQTILSGIAYIACNGKPIYGLPDDAKVFGLGRLFDFLPVPIVILVVVAVIVAIFMNKTYIGRQIYVTGSNEEATRLSGVKTNRIKIMTYVICGFLCGIAGVVMTGRVSSGQPAAGSGMEMTCLTAVVIGGVSMTGGEGKTFKAIIGVLIISVLSNGLTIMNVGEYQKMIVEGLIFLFAVCFDSLQKAMANRRKKGVQAA
ncbi:MAG: ABC transporter permease [Clostridia bacterium]|nr:ABC transporter permease [Clostridia bacterium]